MTILTADDVETLSHNINILTQCEYAENVFTLLIDPNNTNMRDFFTEFACELCVALHGYMTVPIESKYAAVLASLAEAYKYCCRVKLHFPRDKIGEPDMLYLLSSPDIECPDLPQMRKSTESMGKFKTPIDVIIRDYFGLKVLKDLILHRADCSEDHTPKKVVKRGGYWRIVEYLCYVQKALHDKQIDTENVSGQFEQVITEAQSLATVLCFPIKTFQLARLFAYTYLSSNHETLKAAMKYVVFSGLSAAAKLTAGLESPSNVEMWIVLATGGAVSVIDMQNHEHALLVAANYYVMPTDVKMAVGGYEDPNSEVYNLIKTSSKGVGYGNRVARHARRVYSYPKPKDYKPEPGELPSKYTLSQFRSWQLYAGDRVFFEEGVYEEEPEEQPSKASSKQSVKSGKSQKGSKAPSAAASNSGSAPGTPGSHDDSASAKGTTASGKGTTASGKTAGKDSKKSGKSK